MSQQPSSGACPSCGGSLLYDPGGQDLACEHCRSRRPVPSGGPPAKVAYEGWAGRDHAVEEC